MTTNNWNLDTVHSGINFSVRHMVVSKVRGRFTKFTGNVELDEGVLAVERRLQNRGRLDTNRDDEPQEGDDAG
jgi:hypothetical protein